MPELKATLSTLVIEKLSEDITAVGINVPGHAQNVMSQDFMRELKQVLTYLQDDPPRGLLVESRQSDSFLAGADIDQINAVWSLPPAHLQELCDNGRNLLGMFASLPFPSVAIIDGACLGGGLELALACDLRIVTENHKVILGMPEVKLGLLPGWGGTVRLPRLIGTGPAIELIVSGDAITGSQAKTLGLVDACVPGSSARESACGVLERAIASGDYLKRRAALQLPHILNKSENDFLLATTGAAILGRTKGNYPAPMVAFNTIMQGATKSIQEAAELESRAFSELVQTSVAKQLVRVHRLGERNRRDGGLGESSNLNSDQSLNVNELQKPSVIGAGIMGAGIAARHVRSGFVTRLVDVDAKALSESVPAILEEAAWDRFYQKTDQKKMRELTGCLMPTTQLLSITDADIVIESVIERTDLKRQVLAEIENIVSPNTIICTNTSTNPIATLASVFSDPTRFLWNAFLQPCQENVIGRGHSWSGNQ